MHYHGPWLIRCLLGITSSLANTLSQDHPGDWTDPTDPNLLTQVSGDRINPNVPADSELDRLVLQLHNEGGDRLRNVLKGLDNEEFDSLLRDLSNSQAKDLVKSCRIGIDMNPSTDECDSDNRYMQLLGMPESLTSTLLNSYHKSMLAKERERERKRAKYDENKYYKQLMGQSVQETSRGASGIVSGLGQSQSIVYTYSFLHSSEDLKPMDY
ncbi:MAG: hypothetical protein LBP65_01280 [Puniceicoccales bacterium]|nr:hypothetical protein [Puniceicoccales bacterium]